MPTDSEMNEYLRKHNQSGFKVGDIVTCTRACKDNEQGWANCWLDEKNAWIGKHLKIINDHNKDGFEIDDGVKRGNLIPYYYHAPYFILKKIETFIPIDKIKVTISNEELMLPQCIADLCKATINKEKPT